MHLCFDIGGSRIKAALAEGDRLHSLGDAPTPRDDFEGFLSVLQRFRGDLHPEGISVSIAGVVDPDTNRIKVANIPCADGLDLSDEISRTLNCPTIILNDADCFALAEARKGAGRGHRNVFGVILGTGVGGGLVIDGRLVQGAGGYAGEWGHGPVLAAPFDFPCGCGLRGCVDAACGARGLEKLHVQLGAGAAASTEILAQWHAGDDQAEATVKVWLGLVAPPLAMVLNVVGATIVPVGGGLSNDLPLLEKLDQTVRGMILRSTDRAIVVPALCRPEPGLIGAAEAAKGVFA